MNKTVTTVITLLIFSNICLSQSGWFSLPSAISSELIRIAFVDENTGFCGSYSGGLEKTTNGGNNWSASSRFVGFRTIYFINSQTGYVSTQDSLYRTTNNGSSWSAQNFLKDMYTGFADIWFLDVNTGFRVGGGGFSSATWTLIQKTTNAGINWTNVCYISGGPLYGFESIFFVNNQTGYSVGNALIYKTINGGNNWDDIKPANIFGNFRSVYFINETTGFVAGYNGKIEMTSNSGLNWFENILPGAGNLNSIFFCNALRGFVVGDSGKIFRTTNGGANWYQLISNTTLRLNSVYFVNSNTGFAVGGNGSTVSIILKTMDSGGPPVSVEQNGGRLPSSPSLSQNYPNPFNPVTRIKYDVPANGKGQTANVKLIIYDVLGREIETLVNESQKPGSYEVQWDGSRYASGVYFYKLMTDEWTETKKMVLIK